MYCAVPLRLDLLHGRGVHNTHVLMLQNGYPESWTEKRVRIGFADHRPRHFSDEVVRINHYYSKSTLEYYKRRQIPQEGVRRDFRKNDVLLNFINQHEVEDLAIQRFVPELKRRLWGQARSHQSAQAAVPIAFCRRASRLRTPPGFDTSGCYGDAQQAVAAQRY